MITPCACLLMMMGLLALSCQGFVPSSRVHFRSLYQQQQQQQQQYQQQLTMVSTSSSSGNSKSPAPKNNNSSPAPKYPVQRGEELDARKIIKSARQHLTAIRLNHILFASEALATSALVELRVAALAFDELALQISNCPLTRNDRGNIGWVSTMDATLNDHLDEMLPSEARKKVLLMNTKVS